MTTTPRTLARMAGSILQQTKLEDRLDFSQQRGHTFAYEKSTFPTARVRHECLKPNRIDFGKTDQTEKLWSYLVVICQGEVSHRYAANTSG